VLESVSVLVLERRHHGLPPLPPGRLQLEQRLRRRLPPLGEEHDKGERLERVRQQPLQVRDRGVQHLLGKGRVRLKRAALGLKVQDGA
jgi:hypothetical protein